MKARRLSTFAILLFLSVVSTFGQNESERWLRVEVADDMGRPLRNACVTFVPREGEIIFQKADRRGVVKLKKPAVGDYRIVVKVEGYEAQKREVKIGSASETVSFVLRAVR